MNPEKNYSMNILLSYFEYKTLADKEVLINRRAKNTTKRYHGYESFSS
ncbi:MAG: hypothetical protein BAJALOKI1v1_10005 [Promethearchaeota archaeon]|nr:MAG: hypothetical protein BAJALOKI1v1_10005 [Candidatus Lokiarchaeota archaeon]